MDDRGSIPSREKMGFFLFATASGPVLRPAQAPNQWVPRLFYPGVRRPEREADHSSPFSAEVKNAGSYITTPAMRLDSMVLN
jgi:hypothetical protein